MAQSSRTKKVHLTRPTNERRTMCGKTTHVEETDQPRRVTCLTCRGMWAKNKAWYASQRRKLKK